jgi:hypothetical protein
MPAEQRLCSVRPLTLGPAAHFHGLGPQTPWSAGDQYALVLETEPGNRMPLPGEKAALLLIDCRRGTTRRLAEVAGWNWQLGCMMQWMPPSYDREIIYNDIHDGKYVSIIRNIETGMERVLARPIATVSPDGKFGMSVSVARLVHLRPLPDYTGIVDPFFRDQHPKQEGLWWVDLQSGANHLVLSLDEAVRNKPKENMEDVKHHFDPPLLNPSGTRVLCRQRWARLIGGRPFNERLFTCNPDGSDVRIIVDHDLVAECNWYDDTRVLAWAHQEKDGNHFYLFDDGGQPATMVGAEELTEEGHCAVAPDGRWVVFDTYPDARFQRHLFLYEMATHRRVEIAVFPSPPPFLRGDLRCDLNPVWSRDGSQICVDSAHEGVRQMYVLDVSEIVRPTAVPPAATSMP